MKLILVYALLIWLSNCSASSEFFKGFRCGEEEQNYENDLPELGPSAQLTDGCPDFKLAFKKFPEDDTLTLNVFLAVKSSLPNPENVKDTPGYFELFDMSISSSTDEADVTQKFSETTLDEDIDFCGQASLAATLSSDEEPLIDLASFEFMIPCGDQSKLDLMFEIPEVETIADTDPLDPGTKDAFAAAGLTGVKIKANGGVLERTTLMSRPIVGAYIYNHKEFADLWDQAKTNVEVRNDMASDASKESVGEMAWHVYSGTPIYTESLFMDNNIENGLLAEINEDGIDINTENTEIPDYYIGDPELCEKTYLVLVLDPFQHIPDVNRSNNFVFWPLHRNCDKYEMEEKTCSVIPDYGSFGQNALFMNDDSFLFGSFYSFIGEKNGIVKRHMESTCAVETVLYDHYVNVGYNDLKDTCQSLSVLWERYMDRNTPILDDVVALLDTLSTDVKEANEDADQVKRAVSAVHQVLEAVKDDEDLSQSFYQTFMDEDEDGGKGMRGRGDDDMPYNVESDEDDMPDKHESERDDMEGSKPRKKRPRDDEDMNNMGGDDDDDDYDYDDMEWHGVSKERWSRMSAGEALSHLTHVFLMFGGMEHGDGMGKDKGLLPNLAACIKQNMWRKDLPPEGKLCNRLGGALRDELTDLFKLVIRKRFVSLPKDKDIMDEFFDGLADIWDGQALLWKLPMEKQDIDEVLDDVLELAKEMQAKVESEEGKKFFAMIESLVNSITDSTRESAAKVIHEVQGEIMMGDLTGMEANGGKIGTMPTAEELCKMYIGKAIVQTENRRWMEENGKGMKKSRGGKKKSLVVWRAEDNNIQRGTFCDLTNAWSWRSVAMCSCSHDSCSSLDGMEE